MTTRTGRHQVVCDVIAALMWAPKTIKMLSEETGQDKSDLRCTLKTMCNNGIVYRHSLYKDTSVQADGNKISGYHAIMFAMNSKPFEHSDFERSK